MMAQVQYQTFSESQLLASLAVEALIDEVNLTPKPALVDRRGSGAHNDLTLELMERSAKSLRPMFEEMAQAAIHHGEICLALREDIGEIGRQGEKTMMLATDGVNTHRGAIWALGLMVTAATLARTNQQYLSAVELCQLAGQIAQLEDRFIPKQALSHGQEVQKKLGILGAKEQAQQGFPTIVNFGLKQLYQSRSKPMKEEFARVDALLAMMTDLNDTCVLYRSGTSGLKRMQQGAQQVLDLGGSSSLEGRRALHLLEIDLLRMKASAGGAADLLAATLFIDRVEQSSVKNKKGILIMETLDFEFVATEPPVKKALVGCVGSGDLEILMEPGETGKASIQVVTSVDGSEARWHNLFERIFTAQIPPAVNIDIHDFGATPGVVRLRLEQALEEITHD